MPTLPIPMIIALLLGVFLVHRLAARETHASLLALIGICAVQSALIALVQHYGVSFLRPVQPVLAMAIPPVAWRAFNQASGGVEVPYRLLAHASGPLAALLCLAIHPALLDVLIPASFSAYGLAILFRLQGGEDSLLHSRLEGGGLPLLAWRVIALSLLASAACDVLIAYSIASGNAGLLRWLPSLVSSLSLLSLGAVSLSRAIESRREGGEEGAVVSEEEAARDQQIIARLEAYGESHRPYLDPDLTLARLSRKLVLPAKQLSAAINRVKGENVSRYVNRQRVEHACRLLRNGSSITAAMLESGFNTKSNFNREFLRVMKKPPREWIADAAARSQAE
jgi:AraC-like DNA-binding protein